VVGSHRLASAWKAGRFELDPGAYCHPTFYTNLVAAVGFVTSPRNMEETGHPARPPNPCSGRSGNSPSSCPAPMPSRPRWSDLYAQRFLTGCVVPGAADEKEVFSGAGTVGPTLKVFHIPAAAS